MGKILKRTNKIFRLIVSCFIFVFFSFNSINISLIQSNVLGKKTNSVYEGIYEASWNSDINDLYDKNFVSSYYNHSTEYFSLDYIVSPVKNVFTNPNNIYVGYYNKKLQCFQYIYDDSLVYLK